MNVSLSRVASNLINPFSPILSPQVRNSMFYLKENVKLSPIFVGPASQKFYNPLDNNDFEYSQVPILLIPSFVSSLTSICIQKDEGDMLNEQIQNFQSMWMHCSKTTQKVVTKVQTETASSFWLCSIPHKNFTDFL